MFDIKDKVVLITGGAAGIGASVVRTLLEECIKYVAILDVDEKNGVAIQEELTAKYGEDKVKFIKCDITQECELEDAFKTVQNEQGYIDVVINNAGIFNDKNFVKEIEINLTALVKSTLQAWNLMRKDEGGKGGTVINVASIAAFSPVNVVPVYSATKSAVFKFSTMLGDDVHYSRTGVRIVTVCFGVTETQLLTKERIGSFDPVIENCILEALSTLNWQTPEQAAKGLLEVYKKGKSASVWIVTSGKPAVDVTDICVKNSEAFDSIILD